MAAPRRLTITVPGDLAEIVEEKVRAGAYDSPSAMVDAGLRTLIAQEAALEAWLRAEVLPGHEEYLADPASALEADALLRRLRTRGGAAGG